MFGYRWRKEGGYPSEGVPAHGFKAFGTFICGGGSSMGYKLAGYDHLGGVEIDPRMAALYRLNHSPKYLFEEDLREFNKRTDLPAELFNLDLFDGSPPCSTFSFAGLREKAWGREKVFREGQAEQVLDDLVFVYADTVLKLSPRVFVMENVAGLVAGNAKAYVASLLKKLSPVYAIQVFLLNAATMGVPQARKRVFVIGLRKDMHKPKLVLNFNEPPIPYSEFESGGGGAPIIPSLAPKFPFVRRGGLFKEADANGAFYGYRKSHPDRPLHTITSSGGITHYAEPRFVSDEDIRLASGFPLDYDFKGSKVQYVCGMSVPPPMTARIAFEVYRQWLA